MRSIKGNLRNVLIFFAVIVLTLSMYELSRRNVGDFGGAYPFAEKWLVKRNIVDVRSDIQAFYKMYQEKFLDTEKSLFRDDPTGFWQEILFFYPERNEVVKVLIAESTDCKDCTVVSLVSFVNTRDGTVRLMNKDFNYFANRREKQIFERCILKYFDKDYFK